MNKKPNLFIAGEPKSGSTALAELIKNHSECYLSNPKEPNYFCDDFHKESSKLKKENNFKFRIFKKYSELYSGVKDEKIICDASVHYGYSKTAAKNIHKFNPNAKIIFLFRNPVDFLYSLHSNNYIWFLDDEKDFKKSMNLEDERKKGNKIPKKCFIPSFLYYSERIKYKEHLERFVKLFGKKNVKVLLFEEFLKDNQKIFDEVTDFLGIKNEKILLKEVNKNKTVKYPKIRNFVNSIKISKILMLILPSKLYRKSIKKFNDLVIKEAPRKPLDPEYKEKLKHRFKPEVIKLNDYLKQENLYKESILKFWDY